MHLKKLELSGFKSFARSTTLEFPSRITAIVGPNGSGKSNIAEAMRWVLGEQSMKSLRGKRGEDLIWNGSTSSPQAGGVPRMGKASVTLLFDNKDGFNKLTTGGRIPLEFEEISVMRKIFRDGLNEYYLNDSQVRLKDIVELIARMGLGETKHNIIGQGEVDRILLSSPRDRRETLEEALGLRVYQLKKHEAERKLEATEANMKQAETLLREIAPHLKFLKSQAQKAEAREAVRHDLRELEKIYFVRERLAITEEKKELSHKKEPFLKKREEVRAEIMKRAAKVGELEKKFSTEAAGGEEDKKFAAFEKRRREIERELGRLEGRVEMERERVSSVGRREIDIGYVQEEIREFIEEIRNVLEVEDRIEAVRMRLEVLIEDLERLLDTMARGGAIQSPSQEVSSPLLTELSGTMKKLGEELSAVSQEIDKREEGRSNERKELQKLQTSLREEEGMLRAKQDEERDLILEIERFRFEEERLGAREAEWRKGMDSATLSARDLSDIQLGDYASVEIQEISKKIERLRARLEEIGGIDQAVVQEFKDTETRHSFLAKEIDDLKQATFSLKSLIAELDLHIKNDFHAGFLKIKEEFHNYFRIIFGGGRASLQLVEIAGRGETDDEGEELAAEEKEKPVEGIEISVDLPRKRIKGLAMLSGGERALTSIALLFAITSVNPPPFLVLDETDAALDEANSQRYAAILKELSKHTQLILVTHNRETMKCAGVLYGVTMGDEGVSRLLSLKLEEAEVYTNR